MDICTGCMTSLLIHTGQCWYFGDYFFFSSHSLYLVDVFGVVFPSALPWHILEVRGTSLYLERVKEIYFLFVQMGWHVSTVSESSGICFFFLSPSVLRIP